GGVLKPKRLAGGCEIDFKHFSAIWLAKEDSVFDFRKESLDAVAFRAGIHAVVKVQIVLRVDYAILLPAAYLVALRRSVLGRQVDGLRAIKLESGMNARIVFEKQIDRARVGQRREQNERDPDP